MKTLTKQYNLFAEKTGRMGFMLVALVALFIFSLLSDVVYGSSNEVSEAIKVLLLVLIGIIGFLAFSLLVGNKQGGTHSYNRPALKNKKKTLITVPTQEVISREDIKITSTDKNDFEKIESIITPQLVVAPEQKTKDEIPKVQDLDASTSSVESSRLIELRQEMNSASSTERALKQQEFFQNEEESIQPKEYLGVNIIDIVKISERFAQDIRVGEIQTLLQSDVHDEHIIAIWILIHKYQHADTDLKHTLFNFYLENRDLVHNWDMIDLAARNIIGVHIQKSDHETQGVVHMLLASGSLWDTRSAVMSTLPSVQAGDVSYGFTVISEVAEHPEELVQSAIGWVLKESYKQKDSQTEEFIKKHFEQLSKQAIRIGTERMEKNYRKSFLKGEFAKVEV